MPNQRDGSKPHTATTQWPPIDQANIPGTASRDSSKLSGAFALLKTLQQSKLDAKTKFRLPVRRDHTGPSAPSEGYSDPANDVLTMAIERGHTPLTPVEFYRCRECGKAIGAAQCSCVADAKHDVLAAQRVTSAFDYSTPLPGTRVILRAGTGFLILRDIRDKRLTRDIIGGKDGLSSYPGSISDYPTTR